MSLKKIAVCGTVLAAAVVATAFAAKADTVVHYTFDDLGDVGTALADSSTIENKASPGTLDATVYGLYSTNKTSSSTRMVRGWNALARFSPKNILKRRWMRSSHLTT